MTVATAASAAEREAQPASPSAAELYPAVDFPRDSRLRELPRLFDPDWVWRTYQERHGRREHTPRRLRIREFSHSLGRTAVVSYAAEWDPDHYLPAEVFTIRIERGKPAELLQYPDDPYLPGLKEAADPDSALRLVNRHVLAIPVRRARVELVRYRPGSRAVLRHGVGRTWFFARAMRPAATAPMLAARQFVGRSGFVVPRLAGYWEDGAVMWMSRIPGENLRQRIRRRRAPHPDRLFDAIETLWNAPLEPAGLPPFNLEGAYRRAKRSFLHKVRDEDAAKRSLDDAVAALDPFVESWRPSGPAQNDFYDDQMLVLRDGRIALVDFEEAGPGDPLLDVGNFLAHLAWASRFGRRRDRAAAGEYYGAMRAAALERFEWSERDLALREAVCLFRVCTNAIRHPREDWQGQLQAGLALVNETLA